jgi:hypothetical protein
MFTEPFPNNEASPSNHMRDVHADTKTDGQGGIYEVRRYDGLGCLDVYTKFYKDCFSHSKVNGGLHRYTDCT